ncbi:MAG: TIGR04283 family arsenosugar biosynthesis glycosyltransferase [Bdellovibrionales bacterium]|nr:TIGR04283 family arsenosugar biosynthesis glycosyltransferase [Ramlibacter sp.]
MAQLKGEGQARHSTGAQAPGTTSGHTMTLRIVIPVLNEGASLAQRLHALRPLRERGAEVVVVDSGSTDSTWAVAMAFADRVLLAPRGRGLQMNAGARGSTADVLLFLHADTSLPQDADHLIAAAMQQGYRWGRFNVRIAGAHPMLRVVAGMMNLRSRVTGIATGDQAIFVTRELFETLRGFAPIPLMEDVELSTRLRRLSAPACLRGQVTTSGRRWETHGLWRTIALMWRLRGAYFFGASPQALARRYGYAESPSQPPAFVVAVMARAPVAGQAKTRLAPLLGAAGAARAQRRFTRNALATARAAVGAAVAPVAQALQQAAPDAPTLWCAPDTSHVFFRALERHGMAVCRPQADGDLGARMLQVMTTHLAQQPEFPVLLIGTDCPLLAPAHLHAAALALREHDVVMIPAEDGGYALIGMRRAVPEAFEGIAWSTPQVLAQTRDRLRAAGASWHELPALWDVDEPADWERLQALYGLQSASPPSPATQHD